MKLTNYEGELEDATEAMERIHSRGPFGAPSQEDTKHLAYDVAIVMHFLKTTNPRLVSEIKTLLDT